ncbi:alginate export family protein [Pseudoalteromonas sp. SWXJZ94C]|uniref:alginate export family protein n=1 Tax=Pseudoalteromonas sp. SWXJZ94C TaxID=2792065 RepID=UPI0018CD219E|nr:alginate export family protein [Pseudoalteromonas sp. SWXJZ94C]MBH0055710.1 alginate export family protein [Pseudoalteromonas sp. SWXJZ94C]
MLNYKNNLPIIFILGCFTAPSISFAAQTDLDFRLRFESVDQNNALKDASGLTLRTRLTHQTDEVNGFSALIEVEDTRSLLGVDDYNNTVGKNTNYSVIADPESTEIDQGFVKYARDGLSLKVGRQVIALDGQRFVGHVGWRQDRQTFDAATINYAFNNIDLQYSYLNKRNRIFADDKDIKSSDHLINASFKTDYGKVVLYSYLLSDDALQDDSLDTYGLSFNGNKTLNDITFYYKAEYATQSASTSVSDFDADYYALEGGVDINGFGSESITLKAGIESLGSDSGDYGFAAPLATMHKFNGWADMFLSTPTQGLDDTYISLNGKAFDGKWLVAYHSFDANEQSNGVDDLGRELNVQYIKPINKTYSVGAKYADYSAGDTAANKVDTQKLWVWMSAKF